MDWWSAAALWRWQPCGTLLGHGGNAQDLWDIGPCVGPKGIRSREGRTDSEGRAPRGGSAQRA
jgi:hypothetical protein